MRVKISANPPLPPVKAWFPLTLSSTQSTRTIASFKTLLCATLPAFRGVVPASLRFSIDGFELLDNSELTIVRDGDLICVDVLSQDATALDWTVSHRLLEPAASLKRKRHTSTTSLSGSESESESTITSSSTSESESESKSTSNSDDSSRSATSHVRRTEPLRIQAREHTQQALSVQPKSHVVHSSLFVPPGYGKPQTRSRNLRRRLKRMHARETANVPQGGPTSGANAQVILDASGDAHSTPTLMSLSLRNKNKARNFKSLMGRPLAPKIIFEDQEDSGSASVTTEDVSKIQASSIQALPRLVPPSSRSSLPANLFVTSIDVEASTGRAKKKSKMRVTYGDEFEEGDVTLDYGDNVAKTTGPGLDVERLEAIAETRWSLLAKVTGEKGVACGVTVCYKALGINPVTHTPEQCFTVGRVVSSDGKTVVVQPLRAREQVGFGGPVDAEEEVAAEEYTWDDVIRGDWRLLPF